LELFDSKIIKLSHVEVESLFENEAMISKWENPSTWMIWKRKKMSERCSHYTVYTHKTKYMGLKQRLWKPNLHNVEDLNFGWHSWFKGLIMSGDKD
jgi:hypothetical protein